MLGNCAVGRVSIVTTPTSTIRIEMTIATIGRLIKNLAMVSCPLRPPPPVCRAWHNRDAVLCQLRHCSCEHLQSFNSFSHNLLARLQALANDPVRTYTFSHFHG